MVVDCQCEQNREEIEEKKSGCHAQIGSCYIVKYHHIHIIRMCKTSWQWICSCVYIPDVNYNKKRMLLWRHLFDKTILFIIIINYMEWTHHFTTSWTPVRFNESFISIMALYAGQVCKCCDNRCCETCKLTEIWGEKTQANYVTEQKEAASNKPVIYYYFHKFTISHRCTISES